MYTYCIPSIIIRDYASPALRSPSEQNFLPTETIKWTHHEPYQVDVYMYHIVLYQYQFDETNESDKLKQPKFSHPWLKRDLEPNMKKRH